MKLLPPRSTSGKLFVVGATVGPLVDSLHNQCLLQYDLLPISIAWPEAQQQHASDYLFCSSWAVPPLLGVAYVILGGVLPRIFEALMRSPATSVDSSCDRSKDRSLMLGARALVAVVTTALIVKLSEFLETNPGLLEGSLLRALIPSGDANILVMLLAAMSQWALLDATLPALLAASITCVGGPLSELPFLANGFWHYLPEAGDYLPLKDVTMNSVASSLLSDNYRELALSSITGPCYFAVTMDAIALGRWFDSQENQETTQ